MHDLLLWLVGSVALYAAGSNVSWSWERQAAEPGGPFLRRPWTDLLRAAYFVGIPALALALRVPSSAQMGLPQVSGSSWTDGGPMAWPRDLLAVLGLALLGGGLVLFGRVWRARAEQPINSAKAFLFKVARHLALDTLRKGRNTVLFKLYNNPLDVFFSLLIEPMREDG